MSKRGGESWGTVEAVDEINATVTIQSGGSCADQPAPEVERARRWLAGVADLLEQKNAAYGNSALAPMRVFSRADRREGLRVRIDDKLSRMARGDGCATEDTLRDLVGYLALLAVTVKPEPEAEPEAQRDGETEECPCCHGSGVGASWNALTQAFYDRRCGRCSGRGRVPQSSATHWTRAKSIAAWDAMCKRHAAEAAAEVEPRAAAAARRALAVTSEAEWAAAAVAWRAAKAAARAALAWEAAAARAAEKGVCDEQ